MSTAAKHLEQLAKYKTYVPVELLIMAKAKDPPTDALQRCVAAYTSHQRVATFIKDPIKGKFIDEWNKVLGAADSKPDVVDVGPAVSTFMAVKDDEELVRGPAVFRAS